MCVVAQHVVGVLGVLRTRAWAQQPIGGSVGGAGYLERTVETRRPQVEGVTTLVYRVNQWVDRGGTPSQMAVISVVWISKVHHFFVAWNQKMRTKMRHRDLGVVRWHWRMMPGKMQKYPGRRKMAGSDHSLPVLDGQQQHLHEEEEVRIQEA